MRFVTLCIVLVAGCGETRSCVPGACVCSDGTVKAQTCLPDGTFAACDCDGDDRDGDSTLRPPDLAMPITRRVFVSSATYSGNLAAAAGVSDGLAAGDSLCTQAALGAGLGGAWKAWLSSSTVNAIDRIADKGPWHLTNGTLVFPNKTSLANSPLAAVERDQEGRYVGDQVWTGTASGGQRAMYQCANWSSSASTTYGETGRSYLTESWTHDGDVLGCAQTFHLYCFEQ